MPIVIGLIVLLVVIAVFRPRGSGKIRLKRVRQIQKGMTKAEITKLVGKPYQVSALGDGVERWMWFQMDRNFGHTSFTVSFQDGIAVGVPEVPEDIR